MTEALFSILVVLISAFGLGLPLAQRLGLKPAEAVAAAPGFSFIIIYLGGFIGALCGVPAAIAWLLLGLSLAALVLNSWRFRRLCQETRNLWTGWLLVMAVALVADALIRSYSGGGWSVDWYEHYARSVYWMGSAEAAPPLFGNSSHLTARPPLMNILCAYVMQICGRDFYIFELASTLLNSCAFLAAALLVQEYFAASKGAKKGLHSEENSVFLLAALFSLSPALLQNLTYSWTKLLPVYFLIMALYFYLKYAGNRRYLTLAGLFLAAGVLSHYSAAVYFVVLAGFFVPMNVLAGRGAPRRLSAAVAGTLPLLGLWVAWGVSRFGLGTTFGSNTSVGERPGHGLMDALQGIWANFIATTVPYFLRSSEQWFFHQPGLGGLRNRFFFLYQTGVFFAFGSVGALLLLASCRRRLRDRTLFSWRGLLFWTYFVMASYAVAIVIHGGIDLFGIFHVSSQCLLVLGMAFIAANLGQLSWPWRVVAAIGFAVDMIFGVLLHVYMESLQLVEHTADGRVIDLTPTFSDVTGANWRFKADFGYTFFADLWPNWTAGPLWAAFIGLLLFALAPIVRLALFKSQREPQA